MNNIENVSRHSEKTDNSQEKDTVPFVSNCFVLSELAYKYSKSKIGLTKNKRHLLRWFQFTYYWYILLAMHSVLVENDNLTSFQTKVGGKTCFCGVPAYILKFYPLFLEFLNFQAKLKKKYIRMIHDKR